MKICKSLQGILFVFFLTSGFVFGQTFNETQGTNSGTSITTGDYNTLYGDSTGARLTSGSGHVLIGAGAGSKMTTAGNSIAPSTPPGVHSPFSRSNIFIGMGAGYSNTTALDNIFIGTGAGWTNTTGFDNIFIGAAAGEYNLNGGDNTFVGDKSGRYNLDGRANTFLGAESGHNNTTGDDNTFVGRTAGRSNTTGYRNTFIGNEAGYDNSTGYFNTYLGDSAGTDNSIGHHNTMVGHASGAATEYVSFNTFVGDNAGWDNNRTNNNNGFNAHGNTYLGAYAGRTNRDGAYNLVMGTFADFELSANASPAGSISLLNNYNVAMGYNSLIAGGRNRQVAVGAWTHVGADHAIAVGDSAKTTGIRSIAIGSRATVSGENSIAIGSDANIVADNQVQIGNSLITSIGGVVNWTATSDQRFKSNVEENVVGLEFVKMLRPVTYNMDPQAIETHFGREMSEEAKKMAQEKAQIRYTGFLAQEVEAAAEAAGYDFSGIDTPKEGHDAYGIRYAEFVVPLVKAIQEQQEIIEGQSQEIQAYESALENLTHRMNQMEAQLQQVAPQPQYSYSK